MEKYGLQDYLLPIEEKILEKGDERTALNVSWSIECAYALAWVLGLIDDNEMDEPYQMCDPERIYPLVLPYSDFEEFKSTTNIRETSEILDMLDLYYNFNWLCVEHRVNPEESCGSLNEEVVIERRKALEWLVCKTKDWNEISLDT